MMIAVKLYMIANLFVVLVFTYSSEFADIVQSGKYTKSAMYVAQVFVIFFGSLIAFPVVILSVFKAAAK